MNLTYTTPDLTKTAIADTATTPTPEKATTTDWNISAPQTMQGQLQSVLSQSSPLMQMAQTNALQGMNKRGLLNSSMAVGESQKALYNYAMPIAQADANLNAQNAQFNTSAKNQADQFNVQQKNAADQFNTQQQNAMGQYNAGQINDLVKTQLDYNNRETLMGLEAQYKTLMQANQSADGIYQQAIKNIADIQNNKDLDAATKSTMINNQIGFMRTGMSLIGKLNNLPGLAEIIQ
jgi:hypothetical protein